MFQEFSSFCLVTIKNVKTNDGKELGEIKEISENFLRLQKGAVAKKKFWIPKYIADAYDGKVLWLLLSEEELLDKYRYGAEPPGEQYVKDLESFRGTPSGRTYHKRTRQWIGNYYCTRLSLRGNMKLGLF